MSPDGSVHSYLRVCCLLVPRLLLEELLVYDVNTVGLHSLLGCDSAPVRERPTSPLECNRGAEIPSFLIRYGTRGRHRILIVVLVNIVNSDYRKQNPYLLRMIARFSFAEFCLFKPINISQATRTETQFMEFDKQMAQTDALVNA